jgi:Lon protease-like protein
VGRIVGHVELEDGTSHIVLEGLRRARVIKVKRKTPYPQLEIAPVVDEASTDLAGCTRDIARVLAFAENIVGELGEEAAPLMQRLRNLANQPGALADAAAGHLVADPDTRRALLECLSQDQRIKAVADELARLDAQRKLDEQAGGEETQGFNGDLWGWGGGRGRNPHPRFCLPLPPSLPLSLSLTPFFLRIRLILTD